MTDAKPAFIESLREFDPDAADEFGNGDHHDGAVAGSFPASDPPGDEHDGEEGKPRHAGHEVATADQREDNLIAVTLEDGTETELDHGRVVIAAITSCTNTSNPSVMIGAGLLAKKAVERGLESQPWVKTSLAPGSTVVTDYLEQAGLDEYLDQLGFNLVGYGCTTCIGNSGPLPEAISKVVTDNDLVVCSVLSGNRNFEGRINQDVRNNYLASPPLCVAYALAGRMDIDILEEPLGARLRRRAGLSSRPLAVERGDQAGGRRRGPLRHVHQELRGRVQGRRALGRPRHARGRPLHLARLDLRPQADRSSRGWRRSPPSWNRSRRARARGAGRLGHHRPHLARGRDQEGEPGRRVADLQRRRAARLQLLRLAPRQPRGDDPGDVREHPAAQQAGRARGRLHAHVPGRR